MRTMPSRPNRLTLYLALLLLAFALGRLGWAGSGLDAPSESPSHFLAGLWNARVAIEIFLLFFLMVALMYMGRISALLALPIMAILFGLVAGVPRAEIAETIIAEGSLRLHKTYTVALFGGMLAIFAKERRIAETVIKYTAELAGDKPLVVGLALLFVSMLLFITLGGLGAIIMVGTIILPIMLSLGAPAYVAAGIFLIGICAGGTLNPQAWQFYIEALGVPQERVQNFATAIAACYLLIGTVFTLIGLRKAQRRNFLAVYPRKKVVRPATTRPLALLTPLVPILLILQMGQMTQVFMDYHARLQPWKAATAGLALALAGLTFLLASAQKRTARSSSVLREAIELARPMALLGAVVAGLALVFSHVPGAWLAGIQRAAQFWDEHFGAWEFIPAFVAALVYGLATTWKGYPRRAWMVGLGVLVVLWLVLNGARLGAILSSGEPLGAQLAGLLTLNHFVPFAFGLAIALALSWDRRSIQVLSKSLIEGAESVMPAVLLMIGIGMLLKAVAHPRVSEEIRPLLESVIPTTRLPYIVIFTLLGPLALYRGPLNIWGMGIGLAGVMLTLDRLSAAAIMGIFISVGALQGVCDPTNTHNVWIANYLGLDVLEITRKLLPYIWVLTFLGLCIAGFQFVS